MPFAPLLSAVFAACTEGGTDAAGPADTSVDPVQDGFAGLDALGVVNVVVVHIDTLRADHLPMYGGERDTLPTVSDWPLMVVGGYHSTTSWTIPSTASAFTGLRVEHHRLSHWVSAGMNAPLTAETIALHLHNAGFATYLGAGNQPLHYADGLSSGFDTENSYDEKNSEVDLVGLVHEATDWLDSVGPTQPFFVWLQPMDVHAPMNSGAHFGTWADPSLIPFDVNAYDETEQVSDFEDAIQAAGNDPDLQRAMIENLQALYDEEILNVDDGLALLKKRLDDRGLLDSTLIVIAADHGETLVEDDIDAYFGHGGTVRPELMSVPLLFSHPRLPAQSLDCLSENTTLAPTIVQLLGLLPMENIDGIALQNACSTLVRGSTFYNNTEENKVAEMEVTDGLEFLRWSCLRSQGFGYELVSDPIGMRPLDPMSLRNFGALNAEMVEFEAALESDLGAEACIFE